MHHRFRGGEADCQVPSTRCGLLGFCWRPLPCSASVRLGRVRSFVALDCPASAARLAVSAGTLRHSAVAHSLDMGGYMGPIGSTKPRIGDIWPQLAVSACVLLAPPLLMAAGLTYFGSPTPQSTAQRAAASSVERGEQTGSFVQPDMASATRFAAASTEHQPFVPDAHTLVDAPAQLDQAAVSRSTETTKDTSAAAPERLPDAREKSRGMKRTMATVQGVSAP